MRGASFYVELPVRRRLVEAAGCRGRWIRATEAAAGAAVLVVEDEVALGAAMAESLLDAGFTVDRASDGIEALERVREKHFDLIICDLKMPRVAAWRSIASWKRRTPR